MWTKMRRHLERTASDSNGCWVLDRISLLVMRSVQCIFGMRRRHHCSRASNVFAAVSVTGHGPSDKNQQRQHLCEESHVVGKIQIRKRLWANGRAHHASMYSSLEQPVRGIQKEIWGHYAALPDSIQYCEPLGVISIKGVRIRRVCCDDSLLHLLSLLHVLNKRLKIIQQK